MANINLALTSPLCTSRVSLHHLKLFITGAWGFAHRFKATAVTSNDIHEKSENMMNPIALCS